jgi:hypothetical protein
MKEPDVEGVASHDGPESCSGAGNDAAEAFDRGMHEHGIELRDQLFRSADAVQRKRQATRGASLCEMLIGSAQSKTRRECRTFLRENREIPAPPVLATQVASRRPEATRR